MSLPPDPFNVNFPSDLHMLMGVATSLFGARALQEVVYPAAVSNSTNQRYRSTVSQTKTTTKMKYAKKRASRKVATVAAVKRMLNGVLERKQLAITANVSPPAADINLSHSYNLTAQIIQGTADGQRVGDSIFLESVTLNIQFVTNLKPAFYKYRVIIGWSAEEYNPSGLSKSGLGNSEIFVAGFGQAASAIVNTKAFSPLYDNIIEINSLLDTFADGKTIRTVLKLNQKFHYQSPGDDFGKSKNLYFICVPFYSQSSGSAPTDIGGIFFDSVVKYKDA